jgi:hypothetical protein
MVGHLDRSTSPPRRTLKPLGALFALGMLALAGCVADVPPPIEPPPVYAQAPYPGPVYQPYYAAPGPYYAQPYYPCCTSFSFGYRSGVYHGPYGHRWHR